jgi:hypothetical protein
MYTEHFDPDQSYTEVFLSHASLYVLGDFKLIDSLKALALFKLHKTLAYFRLTMGMLKILSLLRGMHILKEAEAEGWMKGLGIWGSVEFGVSVYGYKYGSCDG